MYDVIFLATIVAFFALCVAYIRACDRIIGPGRRVRARSTTAPATPSDAEPIERAA